MREKKKNRYREKKAEKNSVPRQAGVPGHGGSYGQTPSLSPTHGQRSRLDTYSTRCVCVCVCVCVLYFLFYIHVVLKNSINLHGKLMSWYVIDHTLVVGDYVIVCNPKSQLCTPIAR